MKCSQEKCPNDADFLYTWPGRPQAGICAEHAPKLLVVAHAIGLFLELLPVLLVLLCVGCGGIDLIVVDADCGTPDPCSVGPGCSGVADAGNVK